MKQALANRILSKVGKLYLYLRLRAPQKIKRELSIKYEGQYRNAGLMLLFDFLMAIGVVVFAFAGTAILYLSLKISA
ncbi:hypothetical protein [Pontibacter chinhatensis]|uniref:Uncharacterized protein n=1 Tax=Pontibacter chinhatensis TaxID=1436961 RepID=A0A1I2YUG7_9BACT|nr:hypothetical protein [Pontibacter chinhatensis]SFH29282.1 hypothetical protein SAMN05421739_11017 [Pontibacter chinhatensis]